MTIVEALKKFYEGNAYNEQELKEADNVLDTIRAKYGPYEGANIAEYLQTAMANGVTPGSGGGGDFGVAEVTFVDCNTAPNSAYRVFIPHVLYDEELGCVSKTVTNSAPSVFKVPLYKNTFYFDGRYAFFEFDPSFTPTVEGDIEMDDSGIIIIYGNGTITLKGEAFM